MYHFFSHHEKRDYLLRDSPFQACLLFFSRLFAFLISYGAGCFTGRLTGSLTFPASSVLHVSEFTFFNDFNVLQIVHSLQK